jgi:hypothetical protein
MDGPMMMAPPGFIQQLMAQGQPDQGDEPEVPLVTVSEAAVELANALKEREDLVGEACALRQKLDAAQARYALAKAAMVKAACHETLGVDDVRHDCNREAREAAAAAEDGPVSIAKPEEPSAGHGVYL